MRGYTVRLASLIFISFLILPPVSLARRVNVPQVSQSEIFDETNNLIEQAENALATEDNALAFIYLDAATSSLKSLDDPLEKASILARVSSLYQKIDSDVKADRCIEKAKELLIQCKDIALGVEDEIISAICFVRIARCYLLLGDINNQYDSMAQVSSVISNMTNNEIADIDMNNFRILVSSIVVCCQERKGFISEDIFMRDFLIRINKARVYFENKEEDIRLAQCEEMEAFLYDKLGARNKAVRFYKRAAHKYEGLSTVGDGLGLLYVSAELSFRAAELCLEIYRLDGEEDIDERSSAAQSFSLASRSYELIAEWEKASESAERAYEINKERGWYDLATQAILWAAVNRGRYADEADEEEVEERMKEASFWVMRGDMLREHGEGITEINVKEAMFKSYQEAIAAYEEAYDIYREKGDLAGMRESIVARNRISNYIDVLN